MTLIEKITKPDMVGATASSLCMLHCLATPLVFLMNACSATCCADTPVWWQLIDYLFLGISFLAIRSSVRNSIRSWISMALLSSWVLLFLAILNETFEVISLPEVFVYIPALSLVALHLYSQKYCQCAGNSCCAS